MPEMLTQSEKTLNRTSGREDQWNDSSRNAPAAAVEGSVARTIEQQTVKIPSDWFLWAAGASIVGSLVLHCSDRKEDGLFVGHWAPTFLILGLYNKLVKLEGSDASDTNRQRA